MVAGTGHGATVSAIHTGAASNGRQQITTGTLNDDKARCQDMRQVDQRCSTDPVHECNLL
jgi:hypothetical protein